MSSGLVAGFAPIANSNFRGFGWNFEISTASLFSSPYVSFPPDATCARALVLLMSSFAVRSPIKLQSFSALFCFYS